MRLLPSSVILSGLLACGGEKGSSVTEPAPSPYASSVFLLELSQTEATWADMAALAAIATSAHITDGAPAVLAVEDADALPPATEDLLLRLQPEHAIVLDGGPAVPHAQAALSLEAENASQWSLALVTQLWTRAEYVVLASEEDYAGAVMASSLAAFLDAPLLFFDQLSEAEIDAAVSALGAQTVLRVASEDGAAEHPADQHLTSVEDVLDWLTDSGHEPDYLALTNPEDRTSGRAQKASLFAPVYTARRGGISLPLSLSMPTDVVAPSAPHPATDYLQTVYDRLGYHPEYLAIVGAHDALPQRRGTSIFDNPVEEHPVSDLPYGEVDDDPFLDVAIGRIVGDTVAELSNLATRSASYELLLDGSWENHFIESGLWGFDELRASMMNVGYAAPEHLSAAEIDAESSLEVGAILHKDHSYCQVLGNAFDLQTTTLYAPAVVLSRGCSVGGIDLLPEDQRSIVDHMLGSGAVAFVGASRNAIAQNTLAEVSMWNHMLTGQSLGRSFRAGINDMIVHWLDENESAALRYSLDIEMLYGDPALTMAIPGAPQSAPAEQVFEGDTLTVFPPEEWTMVAYHPEQLAEWGFDGELFMYTGPGASPQTYWSGSHDSEDMYFGVQLHLDASDADVQQQSSHDAPLGWSGSRYLDRHQDGSVTALWRVRLLDFDPYTGTISAADSEFSYLVE